MTDQLLPGPLVPAEVDLRDFQFMPLDVVRLRDSGLASDEAPETCWAALLLWCAAWHQVPAGSIPANDQWQAKQAGYVAGGRIHPAWRKVKAGAMRNFVTCSDGRLYHTTIASKAIEAWTAKLSQRARTAAATAAREAKRLERLGLRDDGADDQRNDHTKEQRNVVQGTGTVKGQGQGQGQGDSVVGAASQPADASAKASAQPKGTRLPKDWTLPKRWGEWATGKYSQWSDAKVRDEAAKFRNHWTALTGKAATKLDWYATWQNWCMSDIAHRDDVRPNGSHYGRPDPGSTVSSNAAEATARMLREQADEAAKATPPPAAVLALRSKPLEAA